MRWRTPCCLQTDERRPVSLQNTVPLFSFLCLSFSVFLIISFSLSLCLRGNMRCWLSMIQYHLYSLVVSSSSWSVRYTILWKGRGYMPELFYMERKAALANIFPPLCRSYCSEQKLKEGWTGDKREKQTTRETEYDRKMPRVCVSSYLSRFT